MCILCSVAKESSSSDSIYNNAQQQEEITSVEEDHNLLSSLNIERNETILSSSLDSESENDELKSTVPLEISTPLQINNLQLKPGIFLNNIYWCSFSTA